MPREQGNPKPTFDAAFESKFGVLVPRILCGKHITDFTIFILPHQCVGLRGADRVFDILGLQNQRSRRKGNRRSLKENGNIFR